MGTGHYVQPGTGVSRVRELELPGGIPVATVAIGKAGAKNAGYLAAQMLAISDAALAERIAQERVDNAEAIAKKDAELQSKL